MKIMIVEDDEHKSSNILMLIESLNISEAKTILADNVYDAIKKLEQLTPDKIILDMSLPSHKAQPGQGTPVSMSSGGIEFLFNLRKRALTHLPILILTQYPDIEIDNDQVLVEQSSAALENAYGFTSIEACYYESDSKKWRNTTTVFLRR